MWSGIQRYTLLIVGLFITRIVYALFAAGLMVFLINQLKDGISGDIPAFQLTGIAGLLGGLVLSGGIIGKDTREGVRLRRSGVSFIAAALGFMMLGLYLPSIEELEKGTQAFFITEKAIQAGFFIGVLGFSIAVLLLIELIPSLMKDTTKPEK